MKDKYCIWKEISQRESQPSGRLEYCKLYCNGYQFGCDSYVAKGDIAKIQIMNGLQRFEHRKIHALEKGFEWGIL